MRILLSDNSIVSYDTDDKAFIVADIIAKGRPLRLLPDANGHHSIIDVNLYSSICYLIYKQTVAP